METAKTLTFASYKGGVGKSTHAICLTSGLLAKGHKVRVLEIDPQGNTGAWADEVSEHEGNLDSVFLDVTEKDFAEAQDEIFEYLSGPDYVVIDTPGSSNMGTTAALYLSDIVLVPFHLKEWDMKGMEGMFDLQRQVFKHFGEETPDNLVALLNREASFLSKSDVDMLQGLSERFIVREGLVRNAVLEKWIRGKRTISQLREGMNPAPEGEAMNEARLAKIEDAVAKLTQTIEDFFNGA